MPAGRQVGLELLLLLTLLPVTGSVVNPQTIFRRLNSFILRLSVWLLSFPSFPWQYFFLRSICCCSRWWWSLTGDFYRFLSREMFATLIGFNRGRSQNWWLAWMGWLCAIMACVCTVAWWIYPNQQAIHPSIPPLYNRYEGLEALNNRTYVHLQAIVNAVRCLHGTVSWQRPSISIHIWFLTSNLFITKYPDRQTDQPTDRPTITHRVHIFWSM